MAIELVPLCDVRLVLEEPVLIPDTPAGLRVVVQVREGTVTGDRLSGSLVGAGADWFTIDGNGIGSVDVRTMIRTADGVCIYVAYLGRADMSGGPGSAPIYTAPRFEAPPGPYAWLNKVQAVGKGALDGSDLRYEIAEVR